MNRQYEGAIMVLIGAGFIGVPTWITGTECVARSHLGGLTRSVQVVGDHSLLLGLGARRLERLHRPHGRLARSRNPMATRAMHEAR
jgi:hypothetical protein